MQTVTQATEKEKLPPMVNEVNQAEIDAKQAQQLREAAKEQRKQFVTIVPDGPFYRWRRQVGPGTAYVSHEPFATFAAAIEAAIVIAQCYSVPALVGVRS